MIAASCHLPGINVQNLSRVILQLHRAGREMSFSQFQPSALELVQEMIPFDSAWWGNAAAEPMEIHRVYLFNCDDTILETYTPYMQQDFFRAALMAQPGVTINMADLTTRARYVRTALYREVGKRYRVEWSLGTLLVEPVSSLYEFLTLWRHEPKRPFSEAERQTKELLMPHLVEAGRASRLREVLDGTHARPGHWAVADERGYLRETSPGFIHCLRAHWPDWRGSRLPQAMLANVQTATPFNAGRMKFQMACKGMFRYVQVSTFNALDRLSTREREIVQRYARGQSHAAIAVALGLAATTVRNHIANSYRKLAVNNKVELMRRLIQSGEMPGTA